MAIDGPRLNKLKLVYKKAIQEVLKEQPKILEIINDPNISSKDSFDISVMKNSCSSIQDSEVKQPELILNEMKHKLLIAFKQKMHSTNLEEKLNTLDKNIQNNRTSLRDICSEDYIKEIYESYIVDEKEDFIKYLEQSKQESVERINHLNNELEKLNSDIVNIQKENERNEECYLNLVSKLSNVLDR